MRWSIRFQLLVPLLALLAGVVVMSIWAALASANQVHEQTRQQVRQIARTLYESPFPLTGKVLQSMKGLSGTDYLLTTKEGKRVTTLESLPEKINLSVDPKSRWQDITLDRRVPLNDVTYMVAGFKLHKSPNAGATVYIFYPESVWRDAMWRAVRPSLIFGSVGSLAAIGLTVVLAQRLSNRVRQLERRTRLIAEGDFSPMPLPARNDELRDLTQSVNDMAERLAQYQESMQKNERLRLLGQVGGGLAHQLRNGVAGARLAVQLHERACKDSEDMESLDVALRQLALVEMHLTKFLDLGRAEEQRREPCVINSLLSDTVSLLQPQCKHAHIDLQLQMSEKPIISICDGGQLSQVFLNVITNAIEAAGPGGRVEVSLKQPEPSRVLVEVTDSGKGPSGAVANQLFEAFVTDKPEGVGLGLAVAQQIVKAHGGHLRWERCENKTVFTVDLKTEQTK